MQRNQAALNPPPDATRLENENARKSRPRAGIEMTAGPPCLQKTSVRHQCTSHAQKWDLGAPVIRGGGWKRQAGRRWQSEPFSCWAGPAGGDA